jgi:FkbM family methyltransferase
MYRKLQKLAVLLQNSVFARGLIFHNIPAAVEHLEIITYVRPKHLIDVGANKGQFALATLSVVPDVRVDCFEPLPAAATTLENWARTASTNIHVHRVALSAEKGSAEFYVGSREDSSSLFRPAPAPLDMGIGIKETIVVPTDRLENILSTADILRPCLMKIDVQGGELNVLKGIGHLLDGIDYIYLEVSFIELYERQPLFAELNKFLNSAGYNLLGTANSYVSRVHGPTQADALFGRPGFRISRNL